MLKTLDLAQFFKNQRARRVTEFTVYLSESVLGHIVMKEIDFLSFILQITK